MSSLFSIDEHNKHILFRSGYNENLDLEAVSALEEFAFLNEKSALNETIVPTGDAYPDDHDEADSAASASDEVWNVDQNAIKQMKEIYRSVKQI